MRPTRPPPFRTYLSLGDSISIDLYPGLDLQEREELSSVPEGLGAASLFFRNADERWPTFEGRDLVTRFPGIEHVDLTRDGATTGSIREFQLPRIPDGLPAPVLVTLTAGGNDLMGIVHGGRGGGPGEDARRARGIVEDAVTNLRAIATELAERFAEPALLVGDVYDPSDGTGDLGDGFERPRALEALHAYNRQVAAIAEEAGALLVPIHDHFLGHGLTEPDPDARWYWRHNPIEPSARGASEVRRLWLKAVDSSGCPT